MEDGVGLLQMIVLLLQDRTLSEFSTRTIFHSRQQSSTCTCCMEVLIGEALHLQQQLQGIFRTLKGYLSFTNTPSYDYGGAIKENRLVTREKYSELKLLAQFLRVSPAYTTTQPLNQYPVNTINGSLFTTNSALATTQLADVVGKKTIFWIVRYDYIAVPRFKLIKLDIQHTTPSKSRNTNYSFQLVEETFPFQHLRVNFYLTAETQRSVQRLNKVIHANSLPYKIHVTDYDIGGTTVLYSSGEILTWQRFSSRTIIIVHGFLGEIHETAFLSKASSAKQVQGDALKKTSFNNGIATINYQITASQAVVSIGDNLQLVILDRNAAFDFWVPEWEGGAAIVKSPYLIRSAQSTNKGTLEIRGDLNQTKAEVEVFADDSIRSVTYNGKSVSVKKTAYGSLEFRLRTSKLEVSLPSLQILKWVNNDNTCFKLTNKLTLVEIH